MALSVSLKLLLVLAGVSLPVSLGQALGEHAIMMPANLEDGESEDPEEDFKADHAAAEAGDATAQFHLGGFYMAGKGDVGKVDLEQAQIWYRKAADQGHVGAQHEVGEHLLNGRGKVEKDPAEGVKWLIKAAEQGHPVSQHELGDLYLQDHQRWIGKDPQTFQDTHHVGHHGVERSDAEAYKWFKLAADHASATDEKHRGVFFGSGHIYWARRNKDAIKWSRIAVANLMQDGRGTEKNVEEAKKYFDSALDRNNEL